MKSTSRGREAFTLVEILVVIGILAMLSALLVPTVMKARNSAYNAKVKAEIDMLHMALMNYKNEYGSFPPADFGNVPTVGPLWQSNKVNTNHPVYRHLVRIFPRINEATSDANSPYQLMSQMSPAQALVFWLRGFYPNQEYPLTNQGAAGSRKKFYDFDEARLYVATNTADGSQTFSRPAGAMPPFPVYFTGHANSGLPYVYFDSRCYDNQSTEVTYSAISLTTGQTSTARPYFTSTPPANPLWSQLHMAPDTFQIIASGADGHYGDPDGKTPAAFPKDGSTGSGVVTAAAMQIYHRDNITNFASGPLLDAAEALKK